MFELFKKFANNEVMVAKQKVNLLVKSNNQIIEEIHETFYSEVDRLLEQAKISKPLDTDKQDIIDKSIRLKGLGFNNTKEVSIAENEVDRLRVIERENEQKAELIEAINYFSFKYPFYKFITEDSVRKICEKYSLIYGDVSQYKGDVPEKNLNDIESFKIDKKDECYFSKTIHFRSFTNVDDVKYISYDEMFPEVIKKDFSNMDSFEMDMYRSQMELRSRIENNKYFRTQKGKCSLEISAPQKDFNMEGMELKGLKLSKIEIPDPIVLKPVFFKGKKHYLIVTAWGLEANDELVINQNNN